jgi:hypothetical protein
MGNGRSTRAANAATTAGSLVSHGTPRRYSNPRITWTNVFRESCISSRISRVEPASSR